MKARLLALTVVWLLGLISLVAAEAPPLMIKLLAQKKVVQLPEGDLYWRIEWFNTSADARAAAGTWSLVAESGGKTWLFTLGAMGGTSARGIKVAEVGPISRIQAAEYELRINAASGPPGSITPIHSHPGSEAFYVLSGEQSIRSGRGILRVPAGHAEPGHGENFAMQVSSSGRTELHALVMFVVDATQPFSSPACFP